MITVYGLKNCDTCRKATRWLEAEGIAHDFRDFRKDGLDEADVRQWLATVGPATLINRQGTTWKKLDETEKLVSDDDSLTALVMEYPAILKRPVFVTGDAVIVGFKDEQRAQLKR